MIVIGIVVPLVIILTLIYPLKFYTLKAKNIALNKINKTIKYYPLQLPQTLNNFCRVILPKLKYPIYDVSSH